MFVYRLSEPIDSFYGFTALGNWLAGQFPSRTAWALQAVLALADATALHWRGDMRHLPTVRGLPTAGSTAAYLVVKQDHNGDTILITPADNMRWLDEHALVPQGAHRDIGAWTPEETDGPDDTHVLTPMPGR
jgi:hypothetical protein